MSDDTTTQYVAMDPMESFPPTNHRMSLVGDVPDEEVDRDIIEPYVGFFQVGRDFEPSNVTHKFTAAEKERMAQFEATDYLKSKNQIHKTWSEKQPRDDFTQKWMAYGLIGVVVGFTAFVLKQTIERLIDTRVSKTESMLEDGNGGAAYFYFIVHSLVMTLISTCLVVYVAPLAAGSGVPEVMGYLNGVHIPKIFNVKTMAIKWLSCCFAVSSGLPVGPEGPMISLGAAMGAGISQGRSKTLGFTSDWFKRFRNTKDKRDFITGGAAAGVSAAFGAPVGGLLFAMEEVSSFWDQRLTWMLFFGCMCSTFTVNLFASAFEKWEWEGNFGFFDDNATILFHVDTIVRFNIVALPAVIVIGFIGGILGAVFTFVNLKITRWRMRVIKPFPVRRVLEPLVITLIFATLMFVLPYAYGCRTTTESRSEICAPHEEGRLELFRHTCEGPRTNAAGEDEFHYNEAATLMLGSGDAAIRHLFSRGSYHRFGYGALFAFFFIYFIFACVSAGMSISSGLVVPMLLVGALYGRIIGLVLVDLFGKDHAWIDPGVFALIGAGSFFGGVSRLTISLTVIMLEISDDIHLLLPIMLAVMVAKWVADFVTHSLYHALLEIKCVPFLDSTTVVPKLDVFQAADIMNSPAIVLEERVRVSDVLNVLESTTHNGFPVVVHYNSGVAHSYSPDDEKDHSDSHRNSIFKGIILRDQLTKLLRHPEFFLTKIGDTRHPMDHDTEQRFEDQEHARQRGTELPPLRSVLTPSQLEMYLNLAPYVNTSSISVNEAFDVELLYTLFRSMGLRHLTVVSDTNEPVGMITRKDLLGQTIEERIAKIQLDRGGAAPPAHH